MIIFSQEYATKLDIIKLVTSELFQIETCVSVQENLKEQILTFLKTFINEIDFKTFDTLTISKYLYNTSIILKKSSSNIKAYNKLKNKLSTIKQEAYAMDNFDFKMVDAKLKKYNQDYEETHEKASKLTVEIQNFLSKCTHAQIERRISSEKEENTPEINSTSIKKAIDSILDEEKKTSEKQVNNLTTLAIQAKKEPEKLDILTQLFEQLNSNFSTNSVSPEEIKLDSTKLELITKLLEQVHTESIAPKEENNNKVSSKPNKKKSKKAISEATQEPSNIMQVSVQETSSVINAPIQEINNTNSEIGNASTEHNKTTLNQNEYTVSNEIKETSKTFNKNTKVSEETTKVIKLEKQDQNALSSSENEKTAPDIIEDTLIISEKNDTVTLPYKISDLEKLLKENPSEYKDINDVIAKYYTRPFKYYKNSAIARFKETFKLVRERSHGSLKHALDLSIETFFNYDLHPAIISACKTVDELDIYLSCLEYDELEDFKFFKIIFDVMPTVIKSSFLKKSNQNN